MRPGQLASWLPATMLGAEQLGDGVRGAHHLVPPPDDLGSQFGGIGKGPVAGTDDAGMPEVGIGGKPGAPRCFRLVPRLPGVPGGLQPAGPLRPFWLRGVGARL